MAKKAKKYNARYFINKFSAIPHKNWITCILHEVSDDLQVRCCALGHCGVRKHSRATVESAALVLLFGGRITNSTGFEFSVTDINDSGCGQFSQKTPRGRIIAALKVIEKDGG